MFPQRAQQYPASVPASILLSGSTVSVVCVRVYLMCQNIWTLTLCQRAGLGPGVSLKRSMPLQLLGEHESPKAALGP